MKHKWYLLFLILWMTTPSYAFLGFDFHSKGKTEHKLAVKPEKTHTDNRSVDYIYKTIDSLQYSVYKMGGSHFDTLKGVYIVDCSNYVDQILQAASPRSYWNLVDSTGVDFPTTQHYYEFFNDLGDNPYWDKVDNISKLRAGDIIVFRYKKHRRGITRGHVMVVMDKPMPYSKGEYLVRVADSAPTGHSEDTRPAHVSGIGIGTLVLKAHPKTGKPAAYAWKAGSCWKKNAHFAMARPLDLTTANGKIGQL